jgi:predicted ArsR family transcriptional regulator
LQLFPKPIETDMADKKDDTVQLAELDVPLERGAFMRTIIRELSATLQDVVGEEEATGFISLVGQTMGHRINSDYKKALGTYRLSRAQVEAVLVDLKARINGDFYIVESSDEAIVLGNRACPFGSSVLDRPVMCMMTSNVFGSIAADNLGYAKVVLEETIAQGAPACRVVLHLEQTPQANAGAGREYYRRSDEI